MQYQDCSEWRWSSHHSAVVFFCVGDDRPYIVYVSGRAIADDLESGDPLEVAKKHSDRLIHVAGKLIATGKHFATGDVTIKSGDIPSNEQ